MLRWVIDEPVYRNSPRGFPSSERLGAQYRLRDAVQRVPLVPARRLNIVFNFAEALWYVSGRDDLDFIAYYAPSMRRYSADGVRLTGTAYGRAIFGADEWPDQWPTLVRQLRDDPDSKRAVLQVFRDQELTVPDNPDVSCTLGLQFMHRDGLLHGVGFMRANDAYRGMTSDVFSFTFLQELLARELGLGVGEYVHFVGSLHVYDSDGDRVRAVLADPASLAAPAHRFPAMPEGDNWPYVREVLRYEESLRQNKYRLNPDTGSLGLPDYWTQVLLLLELYRRHRYDEPVDGELVAALCPIYRWLIGHWRPVTPRSFDSTDPSREHQMQEG
jgi:thymidylate synthase